jgi:hypothetical protein
VVADETVLVVLKRYDEVDPDDVIVVVLNIEVEKAVKRVVVLPLLVVEVVLFLLWL